MEETQYASRFTLQRIRRLVQLMFLLTFLWLLVQAKYPLKTQIPAELWMRLDPLIALTPWIAH